MHRGGQVRLFAYIAPSVSVIALCREAPGRLPRVKRRCPRLARIPLLKGTPANPVLAAAALAGVVVLSGCQVMSPIQTNVPYQPADGVAVDLGEVQIRGLVVVSRAKGEVGTLSGMVVNQGASRVTITFATGADGSSTSAVAPADSQTRLSGVEGGESVSLPAIAAAPGGIVKIVISTPTSGASEVSVPVLPPDGYYATITPAPAQSTTQTTTP